MKWSEAKLKADSATWADLECRPTGQIVKEEQFEYVLYYCKHTSIKIDEEYTKSFKEVRGKYLRLGNLFGGASYYFYFSDESDRDDNPIFSYGKFGRIEF